MTPLLSPSASARRQRPASVRVRGAGPGLNLPKPPAAPALSPPGTPPAGSVFPDPVRPTPPPGTPTPTPPPGTNGPLDPNYTARVGIANQQFFDTNADLNFQETSARQHYGFDDTSDPFSVAKMLDRNFQIARDSATNSYAARGQFYSGAAQRAQDLAGFNHEQGVDSARRSYFDVLQKIANSRATAGTARSTAIANASSDATIAALQTRPRPDQVRQPTKPPTTAPKPAQPKPASRRRLTRRGRNRTLSGTSYGQGTGSTGPVRNA